MYFVHYYVLLCKSINLCLAGNRLVHCYIFSISRRHEAYRTLGFKGGLLRGIELVSPEEFVAYIIYVIVTVKMLAHLVIPMLFNDAFHKILESPNLKSVDIKIFANIYTE